MIEPEFRPFAKIARFDREIIVTEKLDGTNGLVYVSEDLTVVRAGSRSRWITPAADNFGFARWVEQHADELRQLGPGYHYGEWWGHGIGRKYGLDHKRFSLFNVWRWADELVFRYLAGLANNAMPTPERTKRPLCCHVVAVLAKGRMSGVDEPDGAVAQSLATLRELGSQAVPGFMKPEGVVVFHAASGQLFKITLEKDEGKGDS